MAARRSLRRVLARQWMLFGLILLSSFGAMALLLLYLLEDSFIDARLREVGSSLHSLEQSALPAGFSLYSIADTPVELRAPTLDQGTNVVREFRLADGRYLHALVGRFSDGNEFLLSYDVSDQLKVNAALSRALPWLLLITVLLALTAYGLARRFVRRLSQPLRELVDAIGGAREPAQLLALAQNVEVAEFSELAQLAASAWEKRLAVLERERETLAFLSHELRTPLQSARTSLALLDEDRGNQRAWMRLQRAHSRLQRASSSVLWLGAPAAPLRAVEPVRIAPLMDALLAELTPLAASRGQSFESRCEPDVEWPMPAEVIESVFANLLLNAIQHGAGGAIRIHVEAHSGSFENQPQNVDSSGFGLGLQLVQRLLQRFSWTLKLDASAAAVCVRLYPES